MPKADLPIIIQKKSWGFGEKFEFGKKILPKFDIRTILRFLIPILAIILVIEVGLGVKTARFKSNIQSLPTTIVPISGAKITLNASSPIMKLGQRNPVKLRIDTGGHTINGADIVINYDPGILKLSKDSIETGSVFAEFPLIDVATSSGTIRISGTSSANGVGFSGINSLATLIFTAIAPGKSDLSIDYVPGSTTDSNLIESSTSQDIIEKVENTTITVRE
jgi:hypothetical protein